MKETDIKNHINLIEGDALKNLKDFNNISFCFLDAEKEVYNDYYDIIIPKMIIVGILIADNATSHYNDLKPFIDKILNDKKFDSVLIPIGKGALFCRIL